MLIALLIKLYWSKSYYCWLFSVLWWPCYLQLVLITKIMAAGQGPRTHSQHLNCLVTRIGYENIAMVLETYIILGVCLALVSFTNTGSNLHVHKTTRTGDNFRIEDLFSKHSIIVKNIPCGIFYEFKIKRQKNFGIKSNIWFIHIVIKLSN